MKKVFDQILRETLSNLGLDTSNCDFLQDPKYSKIKNTKFIAGKLGAVTYDYYIRKNWFDGKLLTQNVGRFDMGAPTQDNRVTLTMLVHEICEEALSDPSNEEARSDLDNIRRKLIGSPSGIRYKLKEKIGFDLNNFNEQEHAKLKVLKLFYSIEKEYKINITKLLSDLSLENVEKEFIGDYSVHGEKITELLSKIRRELDDSFHQKANEVILEIVTKWNEKILKVFYISKMPHDKSIRMCELERIEQYLLSLKERLPISNMKAESNVIEALYLRIMQLQSLCRTEEISRITDFILESVHTRQLLNNQDKYMSDFSVDIIDDLESFIEQYKKKIATIVYSKNEISDSEITSLFKYTKYIEVLLKKFNKQMHTSHEQVMTPLFVISCLQEIFLAKNLKKGDDEYSLKNDYHGSDRKGRILYPALNKMINNKHVEEAIELVWIIKIDRRMHANLGNLDEYLKIKSIEKIINYFIGIISKLPDLESMLCWNDFFISQVIIAENSPIINYAGIFDNIIQKETGYNCKLHSFKIFQYFDNREAANIITHRFLTLIKQHIHMGEFTEVKMNIPFNINNEEFVAICSFDDSNRHFVLHNFLPVKLENDIDLMISTGLGKFVNNVSS